MIDRVLKKHVQEVVDIVKNKGYWSTEVQEYYNNFTYDAMQKLDTRVKQTIRKII